MLSLDKISIIRDQGLVIDQLSLDIPSRKTTVIIGQAACGKTTLLHVIAGLLPPEKGAIDTDLSMKEVGLLLQNFQLFPWRTVEENILLGMHRSFIALDKKSNRVKRLANNLGISDLLDLYPKALTTSQVQRVAIAQVLSKEPKLLLMDEPTSQLDAFTSEKIQTLLISLHTLYDLTSVIVTHSIEEALILGHQIAVMKDGRISQIIENPLYGLANIRQEVAFLDLQNKLRIALGVSK
ncbi:ATP-binding cassette domain-containing protein [Granulicatella seriolae]|uniref:ATP-binding cassette domain-containing protein n=1 Tax=Granulicatella seriolae TaxID=2967226 RepID=A0ABT1WMM1_9LACT|nr:ATP-binding cassette domain-containing protein [Granulicatella seriolae]